MSVSKSTGHKMVSVKIGGKFTRVDEGIKDFVMWMNKLDGIETMFSCQGDYSNEKIYYPYVMFKSDNNKSLQKLYRYLNLCLPLIGNFSFNIKYEYNVFWGRDIYVLDIKTDEHFDLNSIPEMMCRVSNHLFDLEFLEVNENVLRSLLCHEQYLACKVFENNDKKDLSIRMFNVIDKEMTDIDKKKRDEIIKEHNEFQKI